MPTIKAEELERIGEGIFLGAGATEVEARTVARLLVASNLAGHDSHGVIRVPQYVAGVERGQIRAGAKTVVEKEAAASAVVNGNWGFGHVTATDAMRIAIEKARKATVGVVTVHRCHHVGRLGAYPPLASAQGMVGLMTNNGHGADKAMAPFGGVGRVLPANCLAMAFPTDRDFDVVLDLTTATAAGGKMRVAAARGERVPEGFVVDSEGRMSTDPSTYMTGGALVPFGGPVAHKGSALAIAFDILSGALSPAGCTRQDPPETGNALFVQAIDVAAFQELAEFRREVGRFIDYVKASRKAPGVEEILVPGEHSHRVRQRRLIEGVPVEDETWKKIEELAGRFGV